MTTVLGIPETQVTGSINLYPNPFRQTATLEFQEIELPSSLFIYDQFGRIVRTETVTSKTFTFNRNSLTPGIYYYGVNGYVGKFVIYNK